MHKRPLAVISVFFIIGIILAWFLPDSVRLFHVFVVTLIFILSTVIFLKFFKISKIFLFLSITSLGALLYLNSNIFPPNHISYFLGKDKVKAEIIGVIKSPAEARGVYYGKVSSRYLFEIEAIRAQGSRLEAEGEWQKISGLTLIKIQTEKDYQYGDRLLVKGTIKRPMLQQYSSRLRSKNIVSEADIVRARPKAESRTNFNYKQYLENQNIFAIINASEKNVTLLSHNYKSNPVIRFAYFVREKLKEQFLEKMPLESGAFMRAILLGDRSELPKKLNESFRNSGTMHILAISGLNVGLIAAFFLYFFRLVGLRREFSYSLTMAFLVFLMLLTGSTPSVVRATIMCVVFLVGILLGRNVDPYNTLATAALFILVGNPKDLFDVGFQLSFLAVLSMVYFTPPLMKLIKKDINFYVRRYLLAPFAVSVSASMGTFPLIMYYFRMFVPISIVSNIFIVPLMFILMIGGLCFSVLAWLPFAGVVLASFNSILASLIFFLAELFSGVKFGHFHL